MWVRTKEKMQRLLVFFFWISIELNTFWLSQKPDKTFTCNNNLHICWHVFICDSRRALWLWNCVIGQWKRTLLLNTEYYGTDRYLTEILFLGKDQNAWKKRENAWNTHPSRHKHSASLPNNASMSKWLPKTPAKLAKKTWSSSPTPKTEPGSFGTTSMHEVICGFANSVNILSAGNA